MKKENNQKTNNYLFTKEDFFSFLVCSLIGIPGVCAYVLFRNGMFGYGKRLMFGRILSYSGAGFILIAAYMLLAGLIGTITRKGIAPEKWRLLYALTMGVLAALARIAASLVLRGGF